MVSRRGILGALAAAAPAVAIGIPAAAAPVSNWDALRDISGIIADEPVHAKWTLLWERVSRARGEWHAARAKLENRPYNRRALAMFEREAEVAYIEAIGALLDEPAPSPLAALQKIAVTLEPGFAQDVRQSITRDLVMRGAR
ncbi:hypothetical protein [Sphingomonas baiyangensis]|uniref:Twin-arginine translocation signal domain-containing protein n=1 Tax=Sphingomonas baiyangensis TaxID=2572576 RepID=A0A4U1L3B8_9SPHN|nr:hypothetical protein [Sphingomonas baiyangensis]TKD50586.1 hypothetical protein FBR43_07265 [Sphingomonas baiyangensis]